MRKSKYQTLFFRSRRAAGSITSSSWMAIFSNDRRIHVQITINCVHYIYMYVLFKIKLYKNCIYCLFHCLFEMFVNMYLFSMFVNIHTCALVLLFGTNCPYECRNNCQMFAIRCVIFYLFAISFFPGVKLHVFGYWTLAWFIDFYSSWQGQGRILYNKVWKDNWTYWDTCQYYILYCSIVTIWVHFKRNYNLFDQVLINVITFVLFSLYLNRS